jgi:hypothetical protein
MADGRVTRKLREEKRDDEKKDEVNNGNDCGLLPRINMTSPGQPRCLQEAPC